MKNSILKISGMVVLLILSLTAAGQCQEFHFPVGLAYASGSNAIVDKMKDNYFLGDNYLWPVGVTFNPYLEFKNGLGFGAALGPIIYMYIESRDNDDRHDDHNSYSYVIPVGLDLRYTFIKKGEVTPYIKAGFRYPITGGDYFGSGKIGAFGALGLEFLRTKRISFGLEVSYDDSKMEIKSGARGAKPNTSDQEITFGGFMIGVFAVF